MREKLFDRRLVLGLLFFHQVWASTAHAQHQVESAPILNVVIGKSAAIFQLLAGENEELLVGGNALDILNFELYGGDGVGGRHVERNGLVG